MGCLFSKLLRQNIPQQLKNDESVPEIKFSELTDKHSSHYESERNSTPSAVPISSKRIPPPPPSPTSVLSDDQTLVQLHTPIYTAIRSYHKTNDTHISFETNDEMELIEEINSSELHVNHLRSGLSGIIPKNSVRLDVDTPLRLAVNDRGIIQRCLMQYSLPGAYLIRRSASDPNGYVLSISQFHEQHNTFDWHYAIGINRSNNCFYFPQEEPLKHLFFSSFQQLIADKNVRDIIPLAEILPYSIEFEEEVWKIPNTEIVIEKKIGEGQFGEVFRASWHKGRKIIPIAIKKLHIRGVTSTVEREIEAMKTLRNLYIVTLYGISQDPITNEILIVTGLMENGDLKSWLKQLTKLPSYSTILRFAKCISSGMVYLELRNYVHRDLACRNILLGPQEKFVKIADLGLSAIADTGDTNQRQQAQSEKLPIRWLAPELLDNQAAYSIKSDVWAFGILLIELWLKGGDPYDKEHVVWIHSAVKDGFVHKKPADCPDDFYKSIICQCLQYQANNRPSFSALRNLFEKWKC